MLLPMKADSFHMGRAQMMMSPRKPMIARKMAKIWRPADAISAPPISITDEQRGSQLPPLSVVHNGVVEVSDDSVGRPGHRDDAQDTTHDEEHTCSNGYFTLGLLIFNAVGRGQSQHGVVDLALHLARALLHAVHPQALPIGLRRDNVASNESRHLPHGQGTDDDRDSQLPPLSVVHNGVVEVSDDSVGRPGHRDDAQDTTHDEEHTCSNGYFTLGLLIFNAVGHQDGDHNQGTGSLKVEGQSQHGVVDLALHLASALHHAVHLQALPIAPPLSVVHNGVVEVSDDSVGRPGHRNDAQHTTHDEEHTCSNGYFALGLLIFNAVGHQDGDHNQGAGSLKVEGQSQHGVVDLALHLARALLHAALPIGLRRDNVASNESRHLPHGQGTDDDVSKKADDCQEDGKNLETCRCHRDSQLPPLSVVHNGVVEVSDDSVGRPGHRDDAQDTTHDEEHTCSNGYFTLGLLIFNAVGHQDGDHNQGVGSLKVEGQRQHGVVDLHCIWPVFLCITQFIYRPSQ
ncbi:hypothetical protein F7725_006843 [Dissostichus mawsoni]|uniref:Uncharacterized protein n=1 Tax=Dissostichus mawsoni TaxID=36200 RepID=A0A7J5XVP8_DISMA|nr:hypothetical protein F7725_006843 [Dissostichus mawsoni]